MARLPENDSVETLATQVIGAQSVLYRLFRRTLGCEVESIRRLELTYFACAVISATYLSLWRNADRDETMDQVTLQVLKTSLPDSGEQISLGAAVREYNARYRQYAALLLPFLSKRPEPITVAPATTLLLHVFECVTRSSARNQMVRIDEVSHVMNQFILDQVEFGAHLISTRIGR